MYGLFEKYIVNNSTGVDQNLVNFYALLIATGFLTAGVTFLLCLYGTSKVCEKYNLIPGCLRDNEEIDNSKKGDINNDNELDEINKEERKPLLLL